VNSSIGDLITPEGGLGTQIGNPIERSTVKECVSKEADRSLDATLPQSRQMQSIDPIRIDSLE